MTRTSARPSRRPAPRTHRPRRRFGQHFLAPAWADRVLDRIAPMPGDVFLEVGPGTGALTLPLAATRVPVVAVEIDRDLASALAGRVPPNVTVLTADFLSLDPTPFLTGLGPQRPAHAATHDAPERRFRVVGNLPYGLSTPILFRLIDLYRRDRLFTDATLMLQREVVDRLVAKPGSRNYGVLTIFASVHARITRQLDLPAGAFRPPPKVRSSLVRLTFGPPRFAWSTRRCSRRSSAQRSPSAARPCATPSRGSTRPPRRYWRWRASTTAGGPRRCNYQRLHGLWSCLLQSAARPCYSLASFPACFRVFPATPRLDTRGGRAARPRCSPCRLREPTARRRARVRVRGEVADSMTVSGAPGVPVDVVALGGLGEFGMNMMLVACGDTALLIDAGVMFPEPELFGVDLVIPDLSALEPYRGRIAALVLTHGHEDHIGAVAHAIRYVDGPVYATPFTLALVRPKLEEHGVDVGDRLMPIEPRRDIEIGPFRLEFLRVTHSMPDCVALALHTPAGTVVHTGDFKIDQTPLDGRSFDLHRFAELGAQGVLALFSDSTNADRRGFTGSERDVIEAFEEIFSSATGLILVAAFATSVYRMQVLVDLAARFERKVAFVGRGMQHTSQIAAELGCLRLPPGLQIRDSDVRDYPARDVLCLCTGSQGEPLAALPRIAINDHRHVTVSAGDVVVFSARVIPGNEKAVARVMNHVARRGADVISEEMKRVHVSGHASEEELKLLLALVKPRFFVPIHGEYRHLSRHARIAALVSPETRVLMAEDGDLLRFQGDTAAVVDRLPAGRVLIDGTRTGEMADEVLRDRRHLAGDGLVVSVVAINGVTGVLEQMPELITRGLAVDVRHEAVLREAPALLAAAIESASREERTDPGLLKERIRQELQRQFRKRVGPAAAGAARRHGSLRSGACLIPRCRAA